jgi:hypothetical protein
VSGGQKGLLVKQPLLAVIASLGLAISAFTSAASAQPNGLPKIVHRTYIGYLIHSAQNISTSGTLTASNPNCTFTLQPGSYENPEAGTGPLGGFLMKGTGSCQGTFQLLLFPYGAGSGDSSVQQSDYGDTGRFIIETIAPSPIAPNGAYTTETTGTYTTLQSYPKASETGAAAGPTAIMLDGITTTREIN